MYGNLEQFQFINVILHIYNIFQIVDKKTEVFCCCFSIHFGPLVYDHYVHFVKILIDCIFSDLSTELRIWNQ